MLTVCMFLLAALLVGVDQMTKLLAVEWLKGKPPIVWWSEVFELYYSENTGIAFSLLEDQRWIFIPSSCLVAVLLIVMLLKSDLRGSKCFNVSCALVLAGGVGNLIDRIVYGYVVDFLYFKLIDFPIFNVADCCICVGAAMLFLYLLFGCKGDELPTMRGLVFGSSVAGKEKAHDRRNENLADPDGTGE